MSDLQHDNLSVKVKMNNKVNQFKVCGASLHLQISAENLLI